MTDTPLEPTISLTPARRKKSGPPAWTHPLIYGAVRAVTSGTQICGVENSIRTGRVLAGAYAQLPFNAKRLDRAKSNLRWCFPDWDEQRVHDCSVESYRHLFTLGIEVVACPRVIAADGYASFVEIGDVRGALNELLRDQPCILVTGHCGNWELLGATMAVLGFPMHALYRPLDIKPLDDWLHRTRSARGLMLVDKFGAARQLPKLMADRKPVAFIADQNAGDRGLFVPFFNRLASAYKTIGVMAMRYQTPIICGTAKRLSGGLDTHHASTDTQRFRYRIEITDVIQPHEWADQPDPLFYITARYRRAIELMVREAPEQYLWMHRYWKSRPRHEYLNRPFPDRLREKIASLPWMTDDDVQRVVDRSAQDAETFAKEGKQR